MELQIDTLKTRHAALRPLVHLSIIIGILNVLLKLFLPFGILGETLTRP